MYSILGFLKFNLHKCKTSTLNDFCFAEVQFNIVSKYDGKFCFSTEYFQNLHNVNPKTNLSVVLIK